MPEPKTFLVPETFARWCVTAVSMFALAACAANNGKGNPGSGLGSRLSDDMPGDVNDVNRSTDTSDDTDTTTLDARVHSRYISLGDSYSSGVGANMADVPCGLSPLAWPDLLVPSLMFSGNDAPIFGACSGAVTQDVVTLQIPALQNALAQDTGVQTPSDGNKPLITVTIGGNDAHFANELITCLGGPCVTREGDISKLIDGTVYPSLINTFKGLQAAAPDADIVAVGYPLLVAPSTDALCDASETGKLLDGAKRDMIRRLVHQMNVRIAQAAKEATILWITDEIEDTFAGFEACAGGNSKYINAADSDDVTILAAYFHPSALGNQTYRDAVLAGLGKLTSTKPAPPAFPAITPATTTPATATSAGASTPSTPGTPTPSAAPAPAAAGAAKPATPATPSAAPAAAGASTPTTPWTSTPSAAPAAASAAKPATPATPSAAPAAASAAKPATPATPSAAPAAAGAAKPATPPTAPAAGAAKPATPSSSPTMPNRAPSSNSGSKTPDPDAGVDGGVGGGVDSGTDGGTDFTVSVNPRPEYPVDDAGTDGGTDFTVSVNPRPEYPVDASTPGTGTEPVNPFDPSTWGNPAAPPELPDAATPDPEYPTYPTYPSDPAPIDPIDPENP